MPQIGYLTAVPEASQHFLASEMFNLVYANEGTLYYKNPDMYGMRIVLSEEHDESFRVGRQDW